jgi:type II secretory pathway pseudopilin PulG
MPFYSQINKKKVRGSSGFTLIETLIYVAIIGGVLSTFIAFSMNVSQGRNKTYVVQEVQSNTRHAMDVMSQRIRAATSVTIGSSTFGSDPGVLQLAMADASKNPTIINLTADNGILQIKEGASAAVSLTSTEVDVTNLVFTNLTDGDRESVRIQMTVGYDSSAVGVENIYSQSVSTAVSVRQ